MYSHQQIIDFEAQSIAAQKNGRHSESIEYSRRCYDAYLMLERPNTRKAANCAHRAASSYVTLAKSTRNLFYYINAYKSINNACKTDKENHHHQSYRRKIIDFSFVESKHQFQKLTMEKRANTIEGKNLLELLNELLPAFEDNLFGPRELGTIYHMLFQLNNAQTFIRTSIEHFLEVVTYYLPLALVYIDKAIKADPDNDFYKQQKIQFVKFCKEKYLKMIGVHENDEKFLTAINLYNVLLEIILDDERTTDSKLATYHHAISNLYLKYKTTLECDEINRRIYYSEQALKHALSAVNLEPWNFHHRIQYIWSLDAVATAIKGDEEEKSLSLFQKAIDENLALPRKNRDLKTLEKCYENTAWIYFKRASSMSMPGRKEMLKQAYYYANKAYETVESPDTAKLVCQTGHAYACVLSEDDSTVQDAIDIFDYLTELNYLYEDLEKEGLVLDILASTYFRQDKLKKAQSLFEQALELHTSSDARHHTRHQLAQTHYMLAQKITYSAERPEDYYHEIIDHYEHGIQLSEMNFEPRKAAVGYFGKGYCQFEYGNAKVEGLKNALYAIDMLIGVHSNEYKMTSAQLIDYLPREANQAYKALQRDNQLSLGFKFAHANTVFKAIRTWAQKNRRNRMLEEDATRTPEGNPAKRHRPN